MGFNGKNYSIFITYWIRPCRDLKAVFLVKYQLFRLCSHLPTITHPALVWKTRWKLFCYPPTPPSMNNHLNVTYLLTQYELYNMLGTKWRNIRFQSPQRILVCVCSRVEWVLRREKRALGKLCQIDLGTQFKNFTLSCCFLTWRRALTVFNIKGHKI